VFAADDMPDTLVLGCTHFPILAAVLGAVLPPHVRIVDSAATTARALAARMGPQPLGIDRGTVRWLATDDAERFARVGGRFFGAELSPGAVEIIDL
jgi:glutamate racemase